MCGIAAYTGSRQAQPLLLDALKTLEYRGYDSAGLAVIDGQTIKRCRVRGDLARLETSLAQKRLKGRAGLGHTRWATHGAPKQCNAHPFMLPALAIVHNGIIENHEALKQNLAARWTSDTDSEAILHQIDFFLRRGVSPADAFRQAVRMLEGSFALVALFRAEPETLYAAVQASPLVAGQSAAGNYLASDPLALGADADKTCFLQDGDIAKITPAALAISDFSGRPQTRPLKARAREIASINKGRHKHFMGKEIHEQPESLARTLDIYFTATGAKPIAGFDKNIKQAILIACGTASYAARLGAWWLEKYARLPAHAEIASEFRYRQPVIPPGTLLIFISQSGETADTLAALKHAQKEGHHCAALVNRAESSLARHADTSLLMHAGAEIGVGATKTFTSQLIALAGCVLYLARRRGAMSKKDETRHTAALRQCPQQIADILCQRRAIRRVAETQLAARRKPPYVLYLGRGAYYPIALEGALKFKEISYIQAEAYPAGEMKHGPLALVTKNVPVVALAPDDEFFGKTLANLEEVKARGGKIILITGTKGKGRAGHLDPAGVITLPDNDSELARAILATLPVQLLAYETAHTLGLNVDRPRNLAKSVTVE